MQHTYQFEILDKIGNPFYWYEVASSKKEAISQVKMYFDEDVNIINIEKLN